MKAATRQRRRRARTTTAIVTSTGSTGNVADHRADVGRRVERGVPVSREPRVDALVLAAEPVERQEDVHQQLPEADGDGIEHHETEQGDREERHDGPGARKVALRGRARGRDLAVRATAPDASACSRAMHTWRWVYPESHMGNSPAIVPLLILLAVAASRRGLRVDGRRALSRGSTRGSRQRRRSGRAGREPELARAVVARRAREIRRPRPDWH